MNLIIFDLETTGFSRYYHEIIQIAAMKVRVGDWEYGERFETFVQAREPVTEFITRLTGITQAQVSAAPSTAEALQQFSRFVGEGATLVAHNAQRFDMPFIRENCARHALPVRETPFIDSCWLSQQLWGGRSGHGLDPVMERLGIAASGRRHDARADVAILAEAVREMWRRLNPEVGHCPVQTGSGVIPAL